MGNKKGYLLLRHSMLKKIPEHKLCNDGERRKSRGRLEAASQSMATGFFCSFARRTDSNRNLPIHVLTPGLDDDGGDGRDESAGRRFPMKVAIRVLMKDKRQPIAHHD